MEKQPKESRTFSIRLRPDHQAILDDIYDECIETCRAVPSQTDIFLVALENLDRTKLFEYCKKTEPNKWARR